MPGERGVSGSHGGGPARLRFRGTRTTEPRPGLFRSHVRARRRRSEPCEPRVGSDAPAASLTPHRGYVWVYAGRPSRDHRLTGPRNRKRWRVRSASRGSRRAWVRRNVGVYRRNGALRSPTRVVATAPSRLRVDDGVTRTVGPRHLCRTGSPVASASLWTSALLCGRSASRGLSIQVLGSWRWLFHGRHVPSRCDSVSGPTMTATHRSSRDLVVTVSRPWHQLRTSPAKRGESSA